MESLLLTLYPILSFGVWIIAVFGFDVLAKDLQKKKKIVATVLLIVAFLAWFEGSSLSDQKQRKIANEKLIKNLQDDGLLKEDDYSIYFD